MVTSIFEVLLEVISVIRDTEVTSADEIFFERSRFDMVEFGEQLRRAREEKGMTQNLLLISYMLQGRQFQDGNVEIGILIYLLLKKYRKF